MDVEGGLLKTSAVLFAGAGVLAFVSSPLSSGAAGLALLLLIVWFLLGVFRNMLQAQRARAAKNPEGAEGSYRAADRDQLDLSADTIDDYRRD
jgi:hypothetical protein